MPLISERINAYELVLVQEDFAYHDALEASAQHPFRSVHDSETTRLVGDGLNRFSQFELGPLTRERWVACNGAFDSASDCLAEKGFSVSTVALHEDVIVTVYNFHAEAGGGDEDLAARAAGIEQMIQHINANAADLPLIVAGDTNLHGFDPDDEPLIQKLLTESSLTDVCRALDCSEELIDRVLFRNSDELVFTPETWRVADEMVSDDGEPLSDHLAVHARLAWHRP